MSKIIKPITLTQNITLASASDLDVDMEAGELRNVSFLTRGPAIGHGFDVDDVMIQQVFDSIRRKPKGVKSRLTHPEASGGIFWKALCKTLG